MDTGEGDTHNTIEGDVHGTSIQAGAINIINVQPPVAPKPSPEPWVRLVRDAEPWRHVKPDLDPSALLRAAADVAGRVAVLRDAAGDVLKNDPWSDLGLAERFSKRVGWLLKVQLGPEPVALDPGEAALLTLIPLLLPTLWLSSASRLSTVEPTNLAATTSPDDDRCSYEQSLSEYARLVSRALMPDLPERPSARHDIGWWLFHRWIRQRAETLKPDAVAELLTDLDVATELSQVLEPSRVSELLHGLRLEPAKLCGKERLSRLDSYDTLRGGEPDEERVRGPFLGLLLGIAHATAIPLIDLPDTVVRHLGIPAPVDLSEFRDTITRATWEKRADGLELSATCHHESVVEALREHAARVDSLLRLSRRAAEDHRGLELLCRLPSHASAERVRAALDPDGRPVFSGWSRFRLDEQRVQELLMGEQLYRDRDLAIRELYQNALDACRYRQAREQYLHRTTGRTPNPAWSGNIKFWQGADPDGRACLDCVDNGIGMGESELTGAFSKGGVRFADLTEFRDEQAEWDRLDQPIKLYPNSRFGIGVLSYFMLADEIMITTCRMGPDGMNSGPILQAVISGPGNFFHIKEIAAHGEPGTRVRLYLRKAEKVPSCVRVLRQLLGIADFHTAAEHGPDTEFWRPGVFRSREQPDWELEGLNAHGALIPTANGQVTWCERGGAILVDGLITEPAKRHGVLASPGGSTFHGAVVNLTGALAPRLSVDRTQILEDVSDTVESLMVSAAEELVAARAKLPTLEWISTVGGHCPRVADIVTRAVTAIAPRTGCFPQDANLVNDLHFRASNFVRSRGRLMSKLSWGPPDHVLLWRMLANTSPILEKLTDLVPELADARPVLPAVPSDVALLSGLWGGNFWNGPDGRFTPEQVVRIAQDIGATPREVALRAAELNISDLDPGLFSVDRVPDTVDLALLSHGLAHGKRVSVGHLLSAQFIQGISVADAASRLACFGFDTRESHEIPAQPDEIDVRLLSRDLDGSGPWLDRTETVPSWHLAWASGELHEPTAKLRDRLEVYGFRVDTACPRLNDDDLFLLSQQFDGGPLWLGPAQPVPAGHVVKAANELGVSLIEAVRKLVSFGLRSIDEPPAKEPYDAELLSSYLSGRYPWLPPGQSVPAYHLVLADRSLSIRPRIAIERLRAYGLHVPDADIADAALGEDRALLAMVMEEPGPWLRRGSPVPLFDLIRVSRRLSMTIERAAERLRYFGMNAPDPAAAIRAALKKVPMVP